MILYDYFNHEKTTMKTLLITIILALTLFAMIYAQPMRDLTVGNKFVYGQLRGFQYGDTAYRFYEQVVRDTTIQSKKYAVVFRSYNRSTSLERADDTTIYVYRNGREFPAMRWNAKIGDSLAINMWGIGCDSCIYQVVDFSPQFPTNNSFTLVFRVPTPTRQINFSILWYKVRGITQFQIDSDIRGVPFVPFENVIMRGATIQGVTTGDTTTYTRIVSVDQPPLQTAAAFSSKAPNPFSESINLDFSLDSPSDVALQIISNTGEVLATLPQGALASGKHSFRWNGKGSNGSETAQGTYFVRLLVNGKTLDTAKVVKIK